MESTLVIKNLSNFKINLTGINKKESELDTPMTITAMHLKSSFTTLLNGVSRKKTR